MTTLAAKLDIFSVLLGLVRGDTQLFTKVQALRDELTSTPPEIWFLAYCRDSQLTTETHTSKKDAEDSLRKEWLGRDGFRAAYEDHPLDTMPIDELEELFLDSPYCESEQWSIEMVVGNPKTEFHVALADVQLDPEDFPRAPWLGEINPLRDYDPEKVAPFQCAPRGFVFIVLREGQWQIGLTLNDARAKLGGHKKLNLYSWSLIPWGGAYSEWQGTKREQVYDTPFVDGMGQVHWDRRGIPKGVDEAHLFKFRKLSEVK